MCLRGGGFRKFVYIFSCLVTIFDNNLLPFKHMSLNQNVQFDLKHFASKEKKNNWLHFFVKSVLGNLESCETVPSFVILGFRIL